MHEPFQGRYSSLLSRLLLARGIADVESAERFLHPDYARDIGDPFGIMGMERAVERILRAITDRESIVIFGDYDCDGIPGSVVLHDLFKKIGYDRVRNYIPHRHHEGYGLNAAAVEGFGKDGVTLLITVDCGITDVEEVALANTLGIDVIVTDHHLPQAVLPPAYVILNSKQEDDTYHDDMLCGAAVAWKLASAILARGKFEHIPEGWEKWLLDMAGLSTVADMVPLVRENRAIAHFGLTVLRRSRRPGLAALLAKARTDQRGLTEDDIGFTIAPRINAASRMDIPMNAFLMLSSGDPAEATALAHRLHALNDERKALVARIMKEARGRLAEREEIPPVLVIGSPSWPVGVVGIVANQLAEAFERPTFVWGKEGTEKAKGSCRSDGTVNIVELMLAAEDGVFADRGGHEFSGGFSLAPDGVHHLEAVLVSALERVPRKAWNAGAREPDAELSIADVNWQTYREIAQLAPFGVGNPKPLFAFPDAIVRSVASFGKAGDHTRLALEGVGGAKAEAIGFFMTPDDLGLADVETPRPFRVTGHLEASTFRGRPELRIRIADGSRR
ncbi:MAG TPA: single-stranded-DNA-specific exonuclease RecJ [Candidatus Paceibacterota bacterium]|nr:single-stranded-DNA-specific exonuclease RecJ [Candidatus Paceibacterota bacterium]